MKVSASLWQCKVLDVHEERRLVRLPDSLIDEISGEFRSVMYGVVTKTSRLKISSEREGGEVLCRLLGFSKRCNTMVALDSLVRIGWTTTLVSGPRRWRTLCSQIQRHEGCHRARGLLYLHLGARRGVQWLPGPLGVTGVLWTSETIGRDFLQVALSTRTWYTRWSCPRLVWGQMSTWGWCGRR